jgi:hypothetical protein
MLNANRCSIVGATSNDLTFLLCSIADRDLERRGFENPFVQQPLNGSPGPVV